VTAAVDEIARESAQLLAAREGSQLLVDVEHALDRFHGRRGVEEYSNLVPIGSLIVSTASLAWTIARDMRQRGAAVGEECVLTEVVESAGEPETPAHKDVIVTVIKVVVNRDRDSGSG
jgi:hypothetical protein